jgi:hypothetical protein
LKDARLPDNSITMLKASDCIANLDNGAGDIASKDMRELQRKISEVLHLR